MTQQRPTAAKAVRARVMVLLLTAEGQATQMWAAESTQDAVNLRAKLLAEFPGYQVEITHLGYLLGAELDTVADELDSIAVKSGDGELSDTDRARRDGIAASAVVLRHRAGLLRNWRLQ